MVALVELTLEDAGVGSSPIKIVPHAIVAISGNYVATVHLSNGQSIKVTESSEQVQRRLDEALGTPEAAAAQLRRFIDMVR